MSVRRETIFSPCRKYRYTLWREWGCDLFEGDGICRDKKFIQFIGLNPSTADETQDDPTIRRCIGFAKSWGYEAMFMTNLFAWRETDSTKLPKIVAPIGPDNDMWLMEIGSEAQVSIAAWGTKGSILNRQDWIHMLIPNLHCLRITKDGFPEHPLYLPKNLKPIPWKSSKTLPPANRPPESGTGQDS